MKAVGNLVGRKLLPEIGKRRNLFWVPIFVAIIELTIGGTYSGTKGRQACCHCSAALVRKPPARAGTRHIGF